MLAIGRTPGSGARLVAGIRLPGRVGGGLTLPPSARRVRRGHGGEAIE
jgi:hypothetical protein